MRQALEFYAQPANYLDGAPMHKDDTGLLTGEDNGWIARHALRKDDYNIGGPLSRTNKETEGNTNGAEA